MKNKPKGFGFVRNNNFAVESRKSVEGWMIEDYFGQWEQWTERLLESGPCGSSGYMRSWRLPRWKHCTLPRLDTPEKGEILPCVVLQTRTRISALWKINRSTVELDDILIVISERCLQRTWSCQISSSTAVKMSSNVALRPITALASKDHPEEFLRVRIVSTFTPGQYFRTAVGFSTREANIANQSVLKFGRRIIVSLPWVGALYGLQNYSSLSCNSSLLKYLQNLFHGKKDQ